MHVTIKTPTMMDSSLSGMNMKQKKKALAQNTNPQIFKYLLAIKNN